jgi:hypothetical protein
MNWKPQVGLAAAILLVIPSAALAQRAARTSSAPRSTAVRAPRSTAPRATNTARSADSSVGSQLSVQDLLNPFPGLGFSFGNLNGFNINNQNLGVKAFIDPATQLSLATALRLSRLNRFGNTGAFLLDGGGYYAVPTGPDQQPQAQQPIIIVQQPQAQQVPEQYEQAPQAAVAAPPLPDEGQFTLVLRDGKQLQAAAFTRVADRIVYITPDGGRRTFALADLDSAATQRINQENGVPIQLPTVSTPKTSLPEASS